MYLKLNGPTIKINTQERAKIKRCFIENFVCGLGGTEIRSKNGGFEALINWSYVTCGRTSEICVVGIRPYLH